MVEKHIKCYLVSWTCFHLREVFFFSERWSLRDILIKKKQDCFHLTKLRILANDVLIKLPVSSTLLNPVLTCREKNMDSKKLN